MSGTPKSDNENVKLLLTGQLWTMGLYEYIVCAILFPPITVLYSHMFWHRGSIGCLASPDNAALYKSFQMPALNRAADTSTLRTWPTRLALKLSLKLVQTIGQPASQLPRLRSPSLLGKYKKKKTYIKLIRYLSLRRQSQSAQAFSSWSELSEFLDHSQTTFTAPLRVYLSNDRLWKYEHELCHSSCFCCWVVLVLPQIRMYFFLWLCAQKE